MDYIVLQGISRIFKITTLSSVTSPKLRTWSIFLPIRHGTSIAKCCQLNPSRKFIELSVCLCLQHVGRDTKRRAVRLHLLSLLFLRYRMGHFTHYGPRELRVMRQGP